MIYRISKRIIDILGAIVGTIILILLFPIIALIIKIDSRGPIFFKQKRCKQNGVEFIMFKFRTMVADADQQKDFLIRRGSGAPIIKINNDPRLTRVGKFLRTKSLDELPQFLNVLKGEMSLVGPRPLITDEMLRDAEWRDARLKVKPGITGLWQIHGRNSFFEEWKRNDEFYVKNMSLWLDIKILLKTIFIFFTDPTGV